MQSYKINATTGAFTFGGVAQFGGIATELLGGPLVIAGNNGHAYTFTKHYCANDITAFYRDSFGAMNVSFPSGSTWPPPPGDGGLYFPVAMAPDNQNVPASHMAIAIHETYEDYCGVSGPPAVASFTVDYKGNTKPVAGSPFTLSGPSTLVVRPL